MRRLRWCEQNSDQHGQSEYVPNKRPDIVLHNAFGVNIHIGETGASIFQDYSSSCYLIEFFYCQLVGKYIPHKASSAVSA